ncbi:MAG: YceI family protein [Myxococcales bacterium]|nr:YceI family protein [Myxococcales bacterium]
MNRNKFILGSLTLAVATLVAGTAFAQLTVKAKGPQKVALSDAIRANQISWLSDAPVEKIKGTAPNVKGNFVMDPANMKAMTGLITVPVKGMKTGNPIRDHHLAGKSWLDARKFPNITFKITKIAAARVSGKKANVKAVGVFTCHGVSKTITVPVEISWKEAGAKTKRVAGDWVKIKTAFAIKLADYKVAGKAGNIGREVGDTIQINATLYGHTVR